MRLTHQLLKGEGAKKRRRRGGVEQQSGAWRSARNSRLRSLPLCLSASLLAAASSSSPLLLRNTQRSVPVNLPLLRRRTESLLRALRLEEYSLSLLLTGDRRVRQLNKQYRGKDKPTDVLSFPFQPLAPSTLPPDQRPLPPTLGDVRDLGEIVISVPYVARQIASGSIDPPPPSVDARLRTLVVHGVCHLLGSATVTALTA